MFSFIVAMILSPVDTTGPQRRAAGAPRCTFATLSPADRRRFQSRYRRRVRTDGQAFADNWLQEQACPTPAQQAAKAKKRKLVGKDGKPCTKTRLEMRASPGFDGAMTMSPVPVCAH